MNILKTAVATAALTVCALATAPASAGPTVGSIPNGTQTNEFIGTFFPGKKIEGYYGAQLYLVGGGATITAQYFGAEAGFVNRFRLGGTPGTCGNPTFTHSGVPSFSDIGGDGLGANDSGREFQADCSMSQAAGLLDFGFSVNSNAFTFNNGANTSNTGPGANFFVSFDNPAYALDTTIDGSTPGGGQSVFLFLDDGGANNDDNHDDMVIRLSIKCDRGSPNCGFTIPEPGSLALVGLALFGAGLARRRVS